VPNPVPGVEQGTYYHYDYHKGLTWLFTREPIARDLREHYQVSKELPPGLLTLVRKLDDRDWLLPMNVSSRDDVDLFGASPAKNL
jgi:hypothetical protein